MAVKESLRAPKSCLDKDKRQSRSKRPIFELTPLEKRVLLSSAAYVSYNFEGSTPNTTGWSSSAWATSNTLSNWASTQYLVGPATLSLTGIPAHTGTGTVSFDIYALDEWDGNGSPSEFTFAVNGETKVDTSFANDWPYLNEWTYIDESGHEQPAGEIDNTCNTQSYPKPYSYINTV